MKTNQISSLLLLVLAAGVARADYDPNWTKDQCDSYSWHGVHERYVFAGARGWIDNDHWDDPSTEGVDCSSYVPRCLAIPEFVGEHAYQPHYYGTVSMYGNGLPHADNQIGDPM